MKEDLRGRHGPGRVLLIVLMISFSIAACAGPQPRRVYPWFEAPELAAEAKAAVQHATPLSLPDAIALASVRGEEPSTTANWYESRDEEQSAVAIIQHVERLWSFNDALQPERGIRGLASPTDTFMYSVSDASGRFIYETTLSLQNPDGDAVWDTRTIAARDIALALLWRHFGKAGFLYILTDESSGAGSWVIGEANGRMAGVYLGPTRSPSGGFRADDDVATRIDPGVLLGDADLTRVLRKEVARSYGHPDP